MTKKEKLKQLYKRRDILEKIIKQENGKQRPPKELIPRPGVQRENREKRTPFKRL